MEARAEVRQKISYSSKHMPYVQLAVMDTVAMIAAFLPILGAWGACVSYVRLFWDEPSRLLFLLEMLPAPFVMAAAFLACVLMVRAAIPTLKPGIYPIGLNAGFLTWYVYLCLGHGVRISGLQPLFFAFYGTKFLYWRAMGAKVHYGTNSSIFAVLTDYPLLKIGKGCTLGANSMILAHMFVGDSVYLAPVEIGDNVFVGAHCMIGPNTKVGDGTWIGMNNRLMKEEIPAKAKLENFEREDFSKKRRQAA